MMWKVLAATGVALLVVASSAWATFPGENGRIAFTTGANVAEVQPTVTTMEPDGSDVRELVRGYDPAWSANGRRIAFVHVVHGQGEIYTMRGDGSGVRRLTFTSCWEERRPSFSPGGGRMVFDRGIHGCPGPSSQVVVAHSDGSDQHVIAQLADVPEWSPNGERIVYNGGPWLGIMRPDGTDKRRLTDHGISAHYSADGRAIFFMRPGGREWPVMKMGPFGGHLRQVPTPVPFGAVSPSPEGGCLIGAAGEEGTSRVNIYAAGGRCPTRGWLTDYQYPLGAWEASWQPLP